jgi:hypothetical protein
MRRRVQVVVVVVVVVAVWAVRVVLKVRSDTRKLDKFGLQLLGLKLEKYVDEVYPRWASAHPNKACPESMSDLGPDSPVSEIEGINDIWGRPLKLLCGANLPPGAKGIGVLSFGEDGKEGTEDDIKSWQ